MPPFIKQEATVKSEKLILNSSSSGSVVAKRNFVGVRDLQKSGASSIDYANMFKRKSTNHTTTSSKSSSSSASSSSSGSSSSKSSDIKSTRKSYERKSSSEVKKSNNVKRFRKSSSSSTPKKIEKSDKVRWTTYKGKKCVIYNGKKITGPKGRFGQHFMLASSL